MPESHSAHTINRAETTSAFDVVIVGAGFAGLYMLHCARRLGFSTRVYEAASGVGGTWFWNRYPGARCDVESLEYSYSFSEELEREWQWTERYASQPEILRYLNHVAERFDLKRDIQFDTRVVSAILDESANRWTILTSRGDRASGKFCVMATGCLSAARVPDFKGTEAFRGTTYHTGHWPHEGVDFTDHNVGVIGTGSSGIQTIPKIAAQARHLFVFQRTPTFSVPAQNMPLSPDVVQDWKVNHTEYRDRARAAQGPRTYLGLMLSGFPNLFTITGSGSPSVLSNMVVSIEQHADWIANCLAYLRERGLASIEATVNAENEWVQHVNAVANYTLFPLANSWYVGANIPGKPHVFMPHIGGFPVYVQKCNEVAANGYQGFALTSHATVSRH